MKVEQEGMPKISTVVGGGSRAFRTRYNGAMDAKSGHLF